MPQIARITRSECFTRPAVRPGIRLDLGVQRPQPITIHVNGMATTCYPGETVAVALLAAGGTTFGRRPSGMPRRMMCNMGVCFDCLVTVNDQAAVRSCMTRVCEGMRIDLAS